MAHEALLIACGMHLLNAWETNKEIPDRKRSAGDLLHRRHSGKLFVFWDVRSAINEQRCEPPCAVIARGTPLENQSFAEFAPKGVMVQKVVDGEKRWVPLGNSDWPSVAEMTDGLIYCAPTVTTVEPAAAVCQDRRYVKELHRRAAILSQVYGMDFEKDLEEVLPHCAR